MTRFVSRKLKKIIIIKIKFESLSIFLCITFGTIYSSASLLYIFICDKKWIEVKMVKQVANILLTKISGFKLQRYD